ncbi:MAG: hypothetical protein LUE14_07850 [Clostridiales bacterium]|nr:hypothetical protein [Clostridiales bacterium]
MSELCENIMRGLVEDSEYEKKPNKETVEALEEIQQMKADPSLGKTYSDVDKMMEDILADDA